MSSPADPTAGIPEPPIEIGVDSETGVLRQALLCRPDFFSWLPTSAAACETLRQGKRLDRERAAAQHRDLVAVLEDAGVVCRFLEPQPELPDLCWTRDSSVATPWGIAVAQLARPERSAETGVVESYFRDRGVEVLKPVAEEHLEGGDVHLVRPGSLLIGYSASRTSRRGARQIGLLFEERGWETRLQEVPDELVHLDVLFSMVAGGLAVACVEILGGDLRSWLGERGIEVEPVSEADCRRLGCNLLSLGGDRVVAPRRVGSLTGRLRARGLEVLEVELDAFVNGGGGVRCLTQPLSRDAGV